MSAMAWILACAGVLCLVGGMAAADQQYGHARTLFEVNDHKGFVLLPSKATAGGRRPWVWYAPTFINGYPNPSNEWLLRQLLDLGWAICGVDVGESCGSPAGREVYSRFYDQLVKQYGLARKACLVPQSRGGLMLYNWAAENPRKVKCIAGIYPVCDLRSYPGLAQAAPAYGMTEQELASHLTENNPIDRLGPLAKAKVPIFHIHGDSDTVVPLDRNSLVVFDRYKALGGKMELVVVKGKGHAEIPEFHQSDALLKFLLKQK